MRFEYILRAAAVLAAGVTCACSAPDAARTRSDAVTSREAKIVDFLFDGEVVADTNVETREAILRQLLYTFGVLRTSDGASGQIGNTQLSQIRETIEGSQKRVAYRAALPVAWPKDASLPASYQLVFPRDVTALAAFDGKYDGRCGVSDHGAENFWYSWNPRAGDCTIDDDVVRAGASVASHANPKLRFPEYDRIWSDGRLDVTAIFGIIDSPDRENDWGYTEATRFLREAAAPLRNVKFRDNRASSSILGDVTLTGTTTFRGKDREVAIDVLVIDKLANVGADFDARFDALSERSDLVFYSGHAGLGANTSSLSKRGKVAPGKYQLVLLNACDTFALFDGTMRERRRQANGAEDPNGTRFLDIISNAQPSRSDNIASVALEVYRATLDGYLSYGSIIGAMPKDQVAVVFGEEDNQFVGLRSLPAVYQDVSLRRR